METTLSLKTDQLGAVTIGWDQIVSIRTDKPVNVVLADGRKVKATMATAGAVVEIATQPSISVAPSGIVTLRNDTEQAAFDRLQHPGWGELWAGTAALGLAGTRATRRHSRSPRESMPRAQQIPISQNCISMQSGVRARQ